MDECDHDTLCVRLIKRMYLAAALPPSQFAEKPTSPSDGTAGTQVPARIAWVRSCPQVSTSYYNVVDGRYPVVFVVVVAYVTAAQSADRCETMPTAATVA